VVLLVFGVQAGASEPDAHVMDLKGDQKAIVLKRGEEPERTPELYEPLFARDVIEVRSRGAHVHIVGPDRKPLLICIECPVLRGARTASPPHVVEPAGKRADAPGLWANLQSMWAAIANPPQAPDVNLLGRATSPRLALSSDARQVLAAGRRALAIPVAGEGPFTLTIKQGDVTHGPFSSSGTLVRTAPVALAPGFAQLEITDARGDTAAIGVGVVAAVPRPKSLPAGEQEAFETMAWAGWLNAQKSGEWALEAVQRLAAIETEYPPAHEMLSRIAARTERR
jgi:hypothetical protein